jgi:hypothetical protein
LPTDPPSSVDRLSLIVSLIVSIWVCGSGSVGKPAARYAGSK